MKKLIFMGTPDFSATVLKGVLESGQYEVLAVVTQPDRAVGRKKEIRMTPVKEVALAYQLPVYQPEKLSKSPELDELMALEADGIVTAAFGQFLPSRLLASFDFAVNVHASLLPKYRGGTIMEMVKEMDAGDMIASRSILIEDSDNVGTLFDKLAVLGRDLLLDTLPAYLAGDIQPQAQDQSLVTFSPNIRTEEEEIDWKKTNRQIFNQIRGMYPWPVAHTLWQGERFKIYEAELADGYGQPGEILEIWKRKLLVATGEGAIALKTVQPAGKPKMPISDFLNGAGRNLAVGDRFGN